MKDYDIDTAREIVIDWFMSKGRVDFTSDDVADILDDYEASNIDDLEKYLESIN